VETKPAAEPTRDITIQILKLLLRSTNHPTTALPTMHAAMNAHTMKPTNFIERSHPAHPRQQQQRNKTR
jgi:hypothetical protein